MLYPQVLQGRVCVDTVMSGREGFLAPSDVVARAMQPEETRLQACLQEFFWALREAGIPVDMIEVVRFSDSDQDRSGDRYTGFNGFTGWQANGAPMIGWETQAATS